MSRNYFSMWKEAGSKLTLVNTMYYLTEDSLRLTVFIAIVLIIDVLAFVLMYFLAKKYWTGLLFAPILLYLAILTIILLSLFAPLISAIAAGS